MAIRKEKKKAKKEVEKSTILLDKEVINLLREAKEYEKQTYNEIIRKMTQMFIEAKKEIEENMMKKEEKDMEKIKNSMKDALYKDRKDSGHSYFF